MLIFFLNYSCWNLQDSMRCWCGCAEDSDSHYWKPARSWWEFLGWWKRGIQLMKTPKSSLARQGDRNPPSPQTLSLLILVSCQTDSCYYLLINLVTRSVRKENLYCFSFATTELASNNNSISVYMAWFCIPLLLNKYALVLNLGLASYLL